MFSLRALMFRKKLTFRLAFQILQTILYEN